MSHTEVKPAPVLQLLITAVENGWQVDCHSGLNECINTGYGLPPIRSGRYVFTSLGELSHAVKALLRDGVYTKRPADDYDKPPVRSKPNSPKPCGLGYRWVNQGETLLPGDEYPDSAGGWHLTKCHGEPACDGVSYRRRA